MRSATCIAVMIGILATVGGQALAQDPNAAGAVLTKESQFATAWRAYDALVVGERVRKYVDDAKDVIEAAGRTVPPDVMTAVEQALKERDTAKLSTQEAAATRKVIDAVLPIRKQLLELVEPVCAFDTPNDEGNQLDVAWKPYPGAVGYQVKRKEVGREIPPHLQKGWLLVKTASAADYLITDKEKIRAGRTYVYRVWPLLEPEDGGDPQLGELLGESQPRTAQRQWIHTGKGPFFVFMLVLCSAVVFYIVRAQSGAELKVRKIAGLEAVDEAVGRATEMGRPILFVPGILDVNDIQTIAGLIVLGRVARTAAHHDAELEVPTTSPLVMTAARETVQTSFANAGRPDAYDESKIYFSTQEQFAYVASVTGTMVRDKPATCFYMGAFYAESLILAETANATGSIQIAGTAAPAQLPFFVAACDYTLIGEEFFAASAYLSGEPHQIGSLKGQDVGKVITGLFLVIGAVLATLAAFSPVWGVAMEGTLIGRALEGITEDLLTFGN